MNPKFPKGKNERGGGRLTPSPVQRKGGGGGVGSNPLLELVA